MILEDTSESVRAEDPQKGFSPVSYCGSSLFNAQKNMPSTFLYTF
jgi:hypothetical protein